MTCGNIRFHPISLFRKDWNPSAIFFNSIFLNILQKCKILYDFDGKFGRYKEEAIRWSWPRECREFIEQRWEGGLQTLNGIHDNFEKLTAMRRLFLVKACRHLMKSGRPVSIRNKDYYLMFSEHNTELSMEDFRQVFGRHLHWLLVQISRCPILMSLLAFVRASHIYAEGTFGMGNGIEQNRINVSLSVSNHLGERKWM